MEWNGDFVSGDVGESIGECEQLRMVIFTACLECCEEDRRCSMTVCTQ